MKFSNLLIMLLTCIFSLSPHSVVFATMTSTQFEVRTDSLNNGGDQTSTSASYILRDSLTHDAQVGASATNYQLNTGFGAQVYDPVAHFELTIQNTSSQVAATALSGSTVTVTSASGFSTNEMIAVVQNEGPSRASAIGRISGISGSDITLDFLSGASLTIDGSSDYVYALDGASLSLGTLSSSSISSAIIGWEAFSDVDDGYRVYVYEDENLSLADDSAEIADVSDGTVTAGADEYGAISSDSTLADSTFDTEDTAFTTSYQLVGSRSTTDLFSRDFLTVKAAPSDALTAGSYSHNLYFVYVGDY